jgi:simple sugar transport system substrate-binding protein
MKKTLFLLLVLVLVLISGFAFGQGKKMQDITIRFFAGGDAGDPFASIVYRGALAAQRALGVKVDYVFSGWDNERMVAQLRDAIAARPDGIAMMGHAGDAAIMPLAEEAARQGIVMIYQNVDVPKVRARFGGAYVGAQLESQGRALAETAIQKFSLKRGDRVIVFGNWGMPGRYIREGASADAFTKAGMVVTKLTITNEQVANTQLLLPVISGAILAQPATKLILYSNSANLGAVPMYMDSLGKKPGQIINIGFDTSPAIVDAFRNGYVQLSSDQQPYLQGFLPVTSLALSIAYGFSLINYDTGAGFVTPENIEDLAALAEAGIR